MPTSRRRFLEVAGALAAASVARAGGAAPTSPLPTRAFGRTGLTVPILGFGSGSRFLMYRDDDRAIEALLRGFDRGITYIDTAHAYGDGKSEERIGRILPEHRARVVVATKIPGRTRDDARRQIDRSLQRLRTDRVDVLHIHDLKSLADLAAIERPDGALKALYEARDQKLTRAIGITSHADPAALATALDRHDFDATQMALNAGLARMTAQMQAILMPSGGFEAVALPVAARKNIAVIAMKVFGQDQLLGPAPPADLLRYSLSLPGVALASCGMPRLDLIDANAEVARAFTPMPEADRHRLADSVTQAKKAALVDFLRDHADA